MFFVFSSNEIENEFVRSYFGSWVDQIDQILQETRGKKKFELKAFWKDELSEKLPEWEWAGQGAYRWVLSPNDSYVVKFAQPGSTNEEGKKLNRLESQKQSEFEGLFPKVFFHHPNWEWIVVEKVTPLMPSDLESMFSIDKDFAFHFGKFIGYHVAKEKGTSEATISRRREDLNRAIGEGWIEGYNKLKSNPTFIRLADIAMKLNLWSWDLSWGNLGRNDKDELVILDSSFDI